MNVVPALGLTVVAVVVTLAVARGAATLLARDGDLEGGFPNETGLVHQSLLGFSVAGVALVYIYFPLILDVRRLLPEWSFAHELAILANATAMTAAALAGLFAVQRGWRPVAESVREDYTVAPAHARRLWITYAATFATLFVGYHLMLLWLPVLPGGILWLLPVVLAATAVFLVLRAPIQPIDVSGLRDPTDEERRRVENYYEGGGRAPGTVLVYPDESPDENVLVTGSGALETLWIRESFLQSASDDELAAAFEEADEAPRRGSPS